MKNNTNLGRGLASLLGDINSSSDNDIDNIANLNLSDIVVGLYQPRKIFDHESLLELSDSIRKNGVIQPIVVVKNGEDYILIAGERRLRASKMAGNQTIPAVVKSIEDFKMLEYALIENIQRENLNIIEEAEGYLRLMGDYGYTQEELAGIVNKSRSHVANILRLNTLPEYVKDLLLNGILTMGHGRCLVSNPNANEIAKIIVAKGLNVRQTEELVKNWDKKDFNQSDYSVNYAENEISSMLSAKYHTKVKCQKIGRGGKISFFYDNPEGLDKLIEKLM
jgi:ParB family chromosome partitioning protein